MDEIITEVMKDEAFYEESDGGVTLSGGEVLYQAEFATELLRQLKTKGIHTASETTGFARAETSRKFLEQVDLLYFDVKHHDEAHHKTGTGVLLKPILKNLAIAIEQKQTIVVRIPVIPNYNDGPANATAFAKLFKQMNITEVALLPFHQFGEKKNSSLDHNYQMQDIPQLHTENLDYFKEILVEKNFHCKVQ